MTNWWTCFLLLFEDYDKMFPNWSCGYVDVFKSAQTKYSDITCMDLRQRFNERAPTFFDAPSIISWSLATEGAEEQHIWRMLWSYTSIDFSCPFMSLEHKAVMFWPASQGWLDAVPDPAWSVRMIPVDDKKTCQYILFTGETLQVERCV